MSIGNVPVYKVSQLQQKVKKLTGNVPVYKVSQLQQKVKKLTGRRNTF